jgi:trigger factor
VAVSKELKHLEHSVVQLTLTIGKNDVRSHYDELIGEYVKSAVIPGFRKGKVPRGVLERKFGEALKEEALSKVINKALTEVFDGENFAREDKPLPYSTPRLEGEPALDFNKDLSFSVIYDVLPKVTVGIWKGLEVEVPDVSVSDEDIARDLSSIQERNALVLDRDDDAVSAKNDVVTIDYCELDTDGNPAENTNRKDFVFTLGSGYNLYQFDDDVIGMKKGETRDITKTFPADYVHQELAGKTLTIRTTLTALKEKNLPALDDELAQDVNEKYHTLDDLKNDIREQLNKSLEKRLREIMVSKILEKVMETTSIDLPESMVNLELDARFRNTARRFGTSTEELLKNMVKMGQSPEKFRTEWRPDAEKALKSRLVVETLIEELKLEASDEEVEQKIEDLAAGADSMENAESVRKYYKEEENAKEYLKEDIKEQKLFDLFVAENMIRKGKKESYLDIMSNNR